MSNNDPFYECLCDALNAIDGFDVEEISNLHRYPADTSNKVFKELLCFACCPTNDAFITLGRKYIQKINRKWRLENILDAAKECLDFTDDWEYRRFLELVDLSAFELLRDVILIGKDSDNPEVREASKDFEEYYDRLSSHTDECFHDEMLKAVLRNDSIFSLSEIARKFKFLGMNKDHMYELLESLRSETKTEEQEDAILDLMDLLFGYCHPAWKIF